MPSEEVVSIITPSYNSKDYFFNTFQSVLKQTYRSFEWIIVDDCSTDGSFEYVSDLAKQDSRIKVFKLDKNSGPSIARNFALDHCTGRYITILDADDVLDDNYLLSQVSFIKDNGPLITSYYRIKSDKGISVFKMPDIISYKKNLKQNFLSSLSTMYDAKIFGHIRYIENLKKSEDYVFWMTMLKMGYECKTNKQILSTYIIHSGSRSSQKIKLIRHNFYIYHKVFKINIFKSSYYIFCWAINGLKKYKKIL